MASKVTGNQNAVMVEDGYDFDPQTGETYFQVWRGSRAAVMTKAAALQGDGYRISRRKHNGPVYQVTGTIGIAPEDGGGSGSETPVDRYRITTQLAQLDLRSNPKLIDAASAEVAWSGTAERKLNAMVRDVDEWLADSANRTTAYPVGWGTMQVAVADLRARGAQSYELKRPILTRIRGFSTSYGSPFDMAAQPVVYTTAALVHFFSIPSAVEARLPTTPSSAPSNTTWAWLWQQQDSDIIPSINRVEEMDSFVYAAWSTLIYDVIEFP